MPKPAPREAATRRTARVAPPAGSWRLPLILGGVCLAVAVTGFLLWRGRPVAAPGKQPLPALVAQAEAGELPALRELAGRHFSADKDGLALRRRLTDAVRPLLKRESGAPLLKAAVAAAAQQECNDLALPMLELLEAWPALPDELGGPSGPATLLARGSPAAPEAPRVVAGLAGLVLKQNAAREVGVLALQRLDGAPWIDVAGIDACLDACAAGLPDAGCQTALTNLMIRVYGRKEQADALGAAAAGWKAFITEDRERSRRCDEIAAWIGTHGAADRIADGAAALEERRRFLAAAQRDLDTWLADAAWPGPLGWKRGDLETLVEHVKQAQYANRSALAGAVQKPLPKPRTRR